MWMNNKPLMDFLLLVYGYEYTNMQFLWHYTFSFGQLTVIKIYLFGSTVLYLCNNNNNNNNTAGTVLALLA